jgi:hypothetical protein
MIHLFLIFCTSIFLFTTHLMNGYFLPAVNKGSSNFLDGGPLRPKPGWYWTQYAEYYYTDTYLDAHGKSLGNGQSPAYNSFVTLTGLAYQFKPCTASKFQIGFDAALPILLYSTIGHNQLNLIPGFNSVTSSGSGIGDLVLGTYVQYDGISKGERPLFTHRIEFDLYFPTGKYDNDKLINPGNNLFYIDPYWAFTFYFTARLATSWRIHYLHCGENLKAKLKPGSAIHFNYTLEGEILPKVWVGINGYFLQQIKNSKVDNIEIPHSKERIFSTGFGALYIITPDDNLFFNLFFEADARNNPQGMRFYLRFFKHF